MAPQALWSGSLRLSLVLIPVKLFPAVSSEDAVSFRMIHKPSGKPIRYLKGVETEKGFEEVPEDEIIKGYEHTKGHHVLIKPEELDELKLEAKHTTALHPERGRPPRLPSKEHDCLSDSVSSSKGGFCS